MNETYLSFFIDNFKVFIKHSEEKITIMFTGIMDFRNNKQLIFHFFEIHNAIVTNNIKNVEIDLMNLEFINSNGISAIVKWIMAAKDYYVNNNYKISILYDNENNWKQGFLEVIKNIFPFIVLKSMEIGINNEICSSI